ncbi:MAG: VWA domain-containing protein, partial [Vicinamibacterales bacterium]
MSGMSRWSAAIAAVLVLSATATAARRQSQQRPVFRSNVEVVQVDVVVVDKDGNPVRGLTQSDFTISDRGKTQPIATFEEVSHPVERDVAPALRSVRLDVATNRAAQERRLVVLVIDDLHIWKGRTDRAKDIAHKVIDALGPESSMAVIFTSGDHTTQVSADPAVLNAAVDTLKGRQTVRRPHPAVDNQRAPHIDPEQSTDAAIGAMSAANLDTLQDFQDNIASYETIQKAAQLLGGGDVRRKAFVLLSEGIGKDLSGIFGAMTPQGDVPQGGTDYISGNTEAFAASSMSNVPPLHANGIIQMMEAMRRGNVATYAIDPRGLVTPGDLAKECFPPPAGDDQCSEGLTDWNSLVRQAQHGLGEIAVASGGFAVTNTNDFTSGVQKIVEDLDHYYLLGFYPADANDKGYRRLDVRIAGHPEYTLRFRHGYQPGGAPTPVNTDPMVSLSAGVLPQADLPLRLAAVALPATGASARVAYALEVTTPWRDLLEADHKIRDTIGYEVVVVDENKNKVRSVEGLQGRLTLGVNPNAGAPPPTVSYEITDGVDLAPGRYELRVSALSTKLGKGGSVYLDLDVPNFASDAVAIGGVAIGYATGSRIPIVPPFSSVAARGAPPSGVPGRGAVAAPRAAGAAATPAAPAPPAPALPFAPTVDREFARADTLRLYVPGWVRDARRQATLSLEILAAGNRPVTTLHVPFAGGHAETTLPLQTLDPGAYVLRATLSDGVNTATHETGFAVK